MILVTGATGQFGSKAIDHLLKKGVKSSEISALVRDPEKGKVLQEKGDYLKNWRLHRSRFTGACFSGNK